MNSLQVHYNGLQPSSNGLQPTSDDLHQNICCSWMKNYEFTASSPQAHPPHSQRMPRHDAAIPTFHIAVVAVGPSQDLAVHASTSR